jgi:hypothetical protein
MAETCRQRRPFILLPEQEEQDHRRRTHSHTSLLGFVDFTTMKIATATAFAAFFSTASAFSVPQPRYVFWPIRHCLDEKGSPALFVFL